MFRHLLFFILIFSCSFRLMAVEILVNKASAPKDQLVLEILNLALAKSSTQTPFNIQEKENRNNQSRSIDNIEDITSGKISVLWAGTNKEYERELLAIRIPILKGLSGHRIFIIRNGEQQQFNAIHNLGDLEQLTAGQVRFGGEAAVLKESGVPTVTTLKYKNLFAMLEGERFDYFPRAMDEPWREVKQHSEFNLTVEKKLLLIYPYATYFFVSRDNPQLAKQIESGFEKAIADGSFDQLFFSSPLIRSTLKQAMLQNRTVIRLPNHNLSLETPLKRKELWLDIQSLKKTLTTSAEQRT